MTVVFTARPLTTAADRHPTARRYLMCRPSYFAVEYVINPWMDPATPVDVPRAIRQWTELKRTYQRLGHQVEEIEPSAGLPDMVFAANAGVVIGGRVLGARFRAAQRADEAEHYRHWFVGRGFRHLRMPTAINEGEGDFAWTGRLLLAGTGFRTEPAAHAEAQEWFGVPVISLVLVDPRFYHLDTALCVLDGGADRASRADGGRPVVAYYPDAFSPGSRRVLADLFPNAIIATERDASYFGLNAVSDEQHVVLPVEATDLGDRLAERGYQPVFVDMSELRRAGGGPKCCTLEIRV
jgi:N-dimethylarginine dimethylaminohydrolase